MARPLGRHNAALIPKSVIVRSIPTKITQRMSLVSFPFRMRKGFLLPLISEVDINCFAHADFLHAHLRINVIFLFAW